MYMSFAADVFSILNSVFCNTCCEYFVILRAHPFQWPPDPSFSSGQSEITLEIKIEMKSA
jgi:hypothetical protein